MRKYELVLLCLFWSALDAVHFLRRCSTFVPTAMFLIHKCFSCCFAASKLFLSPLSQNSRLGVYQSLGGTQPNLIEEPLHTTAWFSNASSKRGQMRNIHIPLPKGNAYFPKKNYVTWRLGFLEMAKHLPMRYNEWISALLMHTDFALSINFVIILIHKSSCILLFLWAGERSEFEVRCIFSC